MMASITSPSTIQWPIANAELKHWFSRDHVPLHELVQIWLQMDKNPETLAQLKELANDPSKEEYLRDLLASRIQFGTAGTA